MTNPNSTQNPTVGEFIQTNDPLALAALILAGLESSDTPGHTIIELGPELAGSRRRADPNPHPCLNARQALAIGARACQHLLTGQPELATFEPADLELASALLSHLAALTLVKGGRA